jgi:hypothetical protein
VHSLGAFIGLGVESSRQKRRYSMGGAKSMARSVGAVALPTVAAPANNGMHPTRDTPAVMYVAQGRG